MADKTLSIVNGQVANLVIKPTFEGQEVVTEVTIGTTENGTDLKGLVTIGALVPDAETGLLTVPLTAIAVGIQEATIVFNYTGPGTNAGVENWGKSTKTVALTVTAAAALAELENVSTPLTMDLWGTQPLTFQVMKDGSNIAPSITSVTVDPASIADKFEFTEAEGVYTFKSIQSSETEVVTATAKLTVAGTDDGVAYSLEADVVLNTNINDGNIPTNRFNVEVQ